jgi:hypothetical protein
MELDGSIVGSGKECYRNRLDKGNAIKINASSVVYYEDEYK